MQNDPRLILMERDHFLIYSENESSFEDNSLPREERSTCCTKEKIKKIVRIGLGATGFIASGAFLVSELCRINPNTRMLALATTLNGAAFSVFLHPIIRRDFRKVLYKTSSDLSYPLLFVGTQLFLNLVPQQNMPTVVTGFNWLWGAYVGKDISHATSLTVADFSLATEPPKEGKELLMLGFSPRNKKAFWIMLTATATAAIASNVFYQLYHSVLDESELSDLQNIGLFQDLVALFSGAVVGHGMSYIMDTLKEEREVRYAQDWHLGPLPIGLKVTRIAKSIFMAFTPSLIGTLLSVRIPSNTLSRYACKFVTGSLLEAHRNLSRREFTNLQIEEPSNQSVAIRSTASKVKKVFNTYWPTIFLSASLIGYMAWVATTTDSNAIHGGIGLMLLSTVVGAWLTAITQYRFSQNQNSRFTNELAFQLLYSPTSFFIYQFLTTIINIYGDDLKNISGPLYGTSLLAWSVWGLAVGNNLATMGQRKLNPLSEVTHPLTMQELSKTLSATLSPQK